MQEKAQAFLMANIDNIRAHLRFIVSGMDDYIDGNIEVAYGNTDNQPTMADNFSIDADGIERAVEFIADKNKNGRNAYIIGSILNPGTQKSQRSSSDDFYAANVVWCDIDHNITAEELKTAYKGLPPAIVVKTGTVISGENKYIRTHLWWKLSEPVTDIEEMKEILEGVQKHFKSDSTANSPLHLMRLGGSVNWQTTKKMAQGRKPEIVEYHTVTNAKQSVTADEMLRAYPNSGFTYNYEPIQEDAPLSVRLMQQATRSGLDIIGNEKIDDGRETKMHSILAGSLYNMTARLGRWPTEQELFDEAWPTYESKVKPRGTTLDADGRGKKLMATKIKSKLRIYKSGKVANARTVEEIVKKCKTNIKHDKPPHVEKADKPPVKWIKANDIKRVIDVKDFVEGMLRDHEMSVIYGKPNCGKTFFVLDLAMHVALGLKWHGKEVEQGTAVYIALEGGHGVRNRIEAFKEYHGVNSDIPLIVIPHAFALVTGDGLEDLLATLKEIEAEAGPIRFIAIDTLARAMAGADENDSKDMGMFVAACDAIRTATTAHLTVVHHAGKDAARGARGSTALLGGIDTEIELTRKDGGHNITAKITKQREMERSEDVVYSLHSVPLGVNRRGKEVTSCVVVKAVEEDVTENKTQAKGKEAVHLRTLADTIIKKGYTPAESEHYPRGKRGVTDSAFKEELRKKGFVYGDEESAETQYAKIKKHLLESEMAFYNENFWWIN